MLPIVRSRLSADPLALVTVEEVCAEPTERCASPEARVEASPGCGTYARSRPRRILRVRGRRIVRVCTEEPSTAAIAKPS